MCVHMYVYIYVFIYIYIKKIWFISTLLYFTSHGSAKNYPAIWMARSHFDQIARNQDRLKHNCN